MYAIIRSGSKQFRVEEKTKIDVELIEGEPGKVIEFDQVLFLHDGKKISVGSPFLKNSAVKGKILGQVAGKKVVTYKYKRRKNCERKQGHRQKYTRIEITSIGA